jgi:hypothetical protein
MNCRLRSFLVLLRCGFLSVCLKPIAVFGKTFTNRARRGFLYFKRWYWYYRVVVMNECGGRRG